MSYHFFEIESLVGFKYSKTSFWHKMISSWAEIVRLLSKHMLFQSFLNNKNTKNVDKQTKTKWNCRQFYIIMNCMVS